MQTEPTVNQLVQQLTADASFNGKTVIAALYQYIEAMRPNVPLEPTEGARNQVALWRALSTMFNKLESDFDDVFRAALLLIDAHRTGVFAETHVFRFMDHAVAMEETDRAAFHRLMTMMMTTANVADRQQSLRQIDMEQALKHGVGELGKQKVNGFYSQFR